MIFLMFLKKVSYAQQGCIYLIKNTVNVKQYYNLNYNTINIILLVCFLFLYYNTIMFLNEVYSGVVKASVAFSLQYLNHMPI